MWWCVDVVVCGCGWWSGEREVRMRNRGQRTRNGDAGLARVSCADGTTFTFTACSLSSNGTNHVRGQIPTIAYYVTTPR